MGSFMIWSLEFKSKKAKDWFEKKYKKQYRLRLIHDHYIKELGKLDGYEGSDFIYEAGYLGYVEAEEIVKDLKKHGITSFKQLCLCDTNDFKDVQLYE